MGKFERVFIQNRQLVLASTSPRRKHLLQSLGISFAGFSPQVEEPEPQAWESPGEFSLRCAELKNDVCQIPDAVILSADTIVTIDDKILGKPESESDALNMLRLLNGRTHTVFTSFCLRLPDGTRHKEICQSDVVFASWSDDVLKAYVNSGECMDKAGAYAVQGKGVFLVSKIEGSWTTVVGLPMTEITSALLEHKIIIPA